MRFWKNFAYVDGILPDGEQIPLCRLRYGGYASQWGFAIYLSSSDKYEDSFLPSGSPIGELAEVRDCACGLYLGAPAAWVTPGSRSSAGDHESTSTSSSRLSMAIAGGTLRWPRR